MRPLRFGKTIAWNPDIFMAHDDIVAKSYVGLDRLQDDAARLHADELAKYVRAKLNLAIRLACEGEHERRSGHWESAEGYKCRWEEVMAEVKRLLPVLRNSGVSLFGKSRAGNALHAGQANREKEPRIGRTNVS